MLKSEGKSLLFSGFLAKALSTKGLVAPIPQDFLEKLYLEIQRQNRFALCMPPLLSVTFSMVYTSYMAFSANNPNDRRCTLTVSQAVDFHLQSTGPTRNKTPPRPVSSSSLVFQSSLASVILPAYPLKRCWLFCFP